MRGPSSRPPTQQARSARRIQVLLVDSDPDATRIAGDFERHGLRVAVASTLEAARTLLQDGQLDFDVVLLELRLPDGRGDMLLPELDGRVRQPAVIIASADLSELAADALEYRPIAVSKPVSSAALLRMVRTVVGGYARPVLRRFGNGFDLTKRETEAMVLVARGLRAKEIAERMACSEATVCRRSLRTIGKRSHRARSQQSDSPRRFNILCHFAHASLTIALAPSRPIVPTCCPGLPMCRSALLGSAES